MTTLRWHLALVLLVLSLTALRADDPEGDRRADPELARFTCRFEERPTRGIRRRRGAEDVKENRFEVRGTPCSPEFFVRFHDFSGKATLERHEVLWPETIELHVVGPRDTLTWIDLTTDGGLTFKEYIGTGKSVSYYDVHGERCAGVKGSAFRVETELVGAGVRVRVTPPPTARANQQWGVSWYSTSW